MRIMKLRLLLYARLRVLGLSDALGIRGMGSGALRLARAERFVLRGLRMEHIGVSLGLGFRVQGLGFRV